MVGSQRYEIRELIGKGGMGEVYKAYDTNLRKFVAVKTLTGISDPEAVKLFRKECEVLSSFDHANIVNITDVGEFKQGGVKKPFFVMPFLSGKPLSKLIADPDRSNRLSVEDAVDIFEHVCRALQAAHDKNVIHRDIKPSNIYVMEDNSVKVIDFGVARMADSRTTIAQRGTLLYMSPEQIQYAPLTLKSDIFSLGVVCYQTLTRHHPFEGTTEEEVRDAILHRIPAPASEFNPGVSLVLSQVIHKAMAKKPDNRFASAIEFRTMLMKAVRNEPIPMFDPTRIRPRIEHARRAFDQGDFQYASEIIEELEAEGHLDPEISKLRAETNRALRQKRIQQLLGEARARMEQQEYGLAMQKVQEILETDPENAYARGLKKTIAEKDIDQSVEQWLTIARHHIDNSSYKHARQALQDALKNRPQDERALQLLAEANRKEQEDLKLRSEKKKAYEAAQFAWQSGEISTALSRMERVLELDRQAPDSTSTEGAAKYQNFYNQVRSEHELLINAYSEAAKHLEGGRFRQALELCDEFVAKYPNYAPLQMLRFNIQDRERQALSRYIADTDRRVNSEPDLDIRVAIWKEAAEQYPNEAHFRDALRSAEQQRDLVHGTVDRAKRLAELGQLTEARAQWESLRILYPQYPGLDEEIERAVQQIERRKDSAAKERWIRQVGEQLESGDYAGALDTLSKAQTEFSGDPELAALQQRAQRGFEHASQIDELRSSGKRLLAKQDYEAGLATFRDAFRLDPANRITKTVLVEALLERATYLLSGHSGAARPLIEEVLAIDATNAVAKNLLLLTSGRRAAELNEADQIRGRRVDDSEVPAKVAEKQRRLSTLGRAITGGPGPQGTGELSGEPEISSVPGSLMSDDVRAATRAVAGAIKLATNRVRQLVLWFKNGTRYSPYFALLFVFILAGIIVGTTTLRRRKTGYISAPQPVSAEVLIQTSPAGASIQLDGKVIGVSPIRRGLPRGTYRVDAFMDGYAPGHEKLPLQPGAQTPLPMLTLQPLPASLRIRVDSNDSTVQLDDGPVQKFNDQEFTLAQLTGSHVLRVTNINITGQQAAIRFDAELASMPAVQVSDAGPFEAILVTNLGGKVRFTALPKPLPASFVTGTDGATEQLQLTNETVERDGISYGSHSLILGKTLMPEHVDITSSPALTIFLVLDRNVQKVIAKGTGGAVGPSSPPPAEAQPSSAAVAKQAYDLIKQAYDADSRGQFVEPPNDNGIFFAKNALALKPDDTSAKAYLDWARTVTTDHIKRAISANNLIEARRLLDAYVALLPTDADGVALQKALSEAEESAKLPPPPKPGFTLTVTYVRNKRKFPGTLLVVSQHLRFEADGHVSDSSSMVDTPCSSIRHISPRSRFVHRGEFGFLVVTTTGKYEFRSRTSTWQGVMKACGL